MKAIITVVGKDRVGIIAEVCTLMASKGVNVLDISQTVMQENFTMTMLVDATSCENNFADLADALKAAGEKSGLAIRAQREDIFNAMHRI